MDKIDISIVASHNTSGVFPHTYIEFSSSLLETITRSKDREVS